MSQIASPRGRIPLGFVRGLASVAVVFVVALVLWELSLLREEWRGLKADWEVQQTTTVIGYVNISPHRSFAAKPADWFHDEGDETRLWSGWTPGVGHGWFRVGRGEIDPNRLSEPFGRDVIATIDVPLVEVGGGARWDRIPPQAQVAGFEIGGVATAYPLLLLEKVEVVNDSIAARPYLVLFTPTRGADGDVEVYDPMLDGCRAMLASSGYFYERKPLLYDRATESLWAKRTEGLMAIAGPRKGDRLRRIDQPMPIAWADWHLSHPRGRLIVGSERPRPPARPVMVRRGP